MSELNRIRLNGLRAIEAVGRLGSLQAAADALGVTPGAVSQQIIRTEAELGRPVFSRTAGGLVLTDFGRALHRHLAEGFRALSLGVALARERSDSVLTISVAPVLAAKWLVPRLTRFRAIHPDIRVRIEASSAMADLNASDIDLAIRIAQDAGPDVIGECLMHQEVFPVCAPDLAETISSPEDLLQVPIVLDGYSRIGWDVWLALVGLAGRPLNIGYTYADAALCLDAAIAGQGMLLGWQVLTSDALASGRLVAPFPQRARTGYDYWMVTARERKPAPPVAAFMAWLRTEMAATAKAFGSG